MVYQTLDFAMVAIREAQAEMRTLQPRELPPGYPEGVRGWADERPVSN